jgi:GWxTD domain-containing protein
MSIRKRLLRNTHLLLLLWCSVLRGQAEMGQGYEMKGPSFHDDIVIMAVPNNFTLDRMNIYIEVANDELQFVKVPEGYEANYEVSVVILDKDGEQENGKIWKKSVQVNDYDQTNEQGIFNFSNEHFDLKSGSYEVVISVQDLESGLAQKHKHTARLPDYLKSELSLSSITFASQVTVDSLGVEGIYPQITDRFKGLDSESFAYFEIYQTESNTQAKVEYEISSMRTKRKYVDSYTKTLTDARTLDYFKIPIDSLQNDAYLLTVNVTSGDEKAKAEKNFYIRWSGMPSTSDDLETAVQQIKYIATKSEWDKIRKAAADKKLEEFKAFWHRHDPTPGTETNEAMDMHYGRVEFANEHFSVTQRKGWQTDMGMLYILLGAPDDVERNPFPRGSYPYEVWQYNRINRSFVFVDYTGFGDFHLTTPFSIYEYQQLLR